MNQIGPFIASAKHIAFITPGFAANEGDTTCIPALQLLVKSLVSKGVEVTVFALHYPFGSTPYVWNGVTVYPINGRNRMTDRLFFLKWRLERELQRVHGQKSIDLLHAFWLNEATHFSLQLGKKFRIPVVATAMGQDVLPTNRYLKQLDVAALKAVVSLSEFHRRELLRNTGIASQCIPFGIRPVSTMTEKCYDLIGVGNLIALKNYSYFLDLCADLAVRKPDFSAILVGKGPERQLLEKRIQELDLTRHVHLLGEQPYDKTGKLISQSRILIHPSTYESFGMVVAEALGCGTYVMAQAVGLAMERSEVYKLTMDIGADSAMVLKLLSEAPPKKVVLDMDDCAERYRVLYEGL